MQRIGKILEERLRFEKFNLWVLKIGWLAERRQNLCSRD